VRDQPKIRFVLLRTPGLSPVFCYRANDLAPSAIVDGAYAGGPYESTEAAAGLGEEVFGIAEVDAIYTVRRRPAEPGREAREIEDDIALAHGNPAKRETGDLISANDLAEQIGCSTTPWEY